MHRLLLKTVQGLRTSTAAFFSSLLLLVGCSQADADPGEIYVNFLARPESLMGVSPGHAFVCIDLHLNAAIKEDCFGFYPLTTSDSFGGPGVVRNEFTKSAISNVTVSLAHRISEETRKAIYAKIQEYAGVDYKITVPNCKNLVLDVASVAGLAVGPNSNLTKPTSIVEAMKTRYWTGTWSSDDAAKRFSLEIKGADASFIENVAGLPKVERSYTVDPSKGKLHFERTNDAATLRSIGIQEKYIDKLIASGAKPSFIDLERVDDIVVGEWHGLRFTLDAKSHINSITQPADVTAKRFNFRKSP